MKIKSVVYSFSDRTSVYFVEDYFDKWKVYSSNDKGEIEDYISEYEVLSYFYNLPWDFHRKVALYREIKFLSRRFSKSSRPELGYLSNQVKNSVRRLVGRGNLFLEKNIVYYLSLILAADKKDFGGRERRHLMWKLNEVILKEWI